MLRLVIPGKESWDEETETFTYEDERVLEFEHSLRSISEWESRFHKPYLGNEELTVEESLAYIQMMCKTDLRIEEISEFPGEILEQIGNYTRDPATATWFNASNQQDSGPRDHSVITAELIYYWMIALEIPFECQDWHINKLLTLVRVCNEKNKPPKKMSQQELMKRNRELNRQRRLKHKTRG